MLNQYDKLNQSQISEKFDAEIIIGIFDMFMEFIRISTLQLDSENQYIASLTDKENEVASEVSELIKLNSSLRELGLNSFNLYHVSRTSISQWINNFSYFKTVKERYKTLDNDKLRLVAMNVMYRVYENLESEFLAKKKAYELVKDNGDDFNRCIDEGIDKPMEEHTDPNNVDELDESLALLLQNNTTMTEMTEKALENENQHLKNELDTIKNEMNRYKEQLLVFQNEKETIVESYKDQIEALSQQLIGVLNKNNKQKR